MEAVHWGAHFRELKFLYLAERRAWTAGAFDLYRPGDPAEVIDFKTHEIGADELEEVAARYRGQVEVYRGVRLRVGPGRKAYRLGPSGAAVSVLLGRGSLLEPSQNLAT